MGQGQPGTPGTTGTTGPQGPLGPQGLVGKKGDDWSNAWKAPLYTNDLQLN